MDIKITDADWGGSDICIDFNKIDFLPRITMSSLHGLFMLNIGFLMLAFNFYVFGKEMREFNRKIKSGELVNEIHAHIVELENKFKQEREEERRQEQEQQDSIKHISEAVDQIMVELKKKKPRYKKRIAEQ